MEQKPSYRADLAKLAGLPEHIKRHKYFCLWKWTWDSKRGAWTKVPYNPRTGSKAKSNDETTFAPLDETLDAFRASDEFDGVGIGLFDGMSGIDIDHHLSAGIPDEFAQGIMDKMNAYTEVSPSGDGVHILFVCAEFAATHDREAYKKEYMFNKRSKGLETYPSECTNRFLTLTGDVLSEGTPGDKSTVFVCVLNEHMLRGRQNKGGGKKGKASTSGATFDPTSSDDRIRAKAMASKNGDKFTQLWNGDTTGYGSPSEADQALCNMLAFWWNRDPEAIDRMFRESGLYREKWDREDYRTATINKAIEDTPRGYDPIAYMAQRKSAGVGAIRHALIGMNESGAPSNPVQRDAETLLKTGVLEQDVSDQTLGRAFAAIYSDRMLYVSEAERFYFFDGKRWKPDTKSMKAALQLSKVFVDLLLGCAVEHIEDERDKQDFLTRASSYLSHNRRMNLIRDAAAELTVSIETFDCNLSLFNCGNCTLDLATMRTLSHDPAHRITKLANCDYDPKAASVEWEKFLLQVLEGDMDTIAYMQQEMGRALVGDISEERMHLLYGVVRSGKSTCANTVREVFGEYGINISPATITKQRRSGQNASNDLARLEGVRFATIPEPPMGMELSGDLVKAITGGDKITARRLYEGERDVYPKISMWMCSNHLPQIDDPTVLEGDRIVVIPFDHYMPSAQRDKALKQRLISPSNRSAILNWLIIGLMRSRQDPVQPPEQTTDATREFLGQADRTEQFLREALVEDPDASMTGLQAFKLYEAWCVRKGFEPDGKQAFFQRLRTLNVLRNRWRGTRNVVAGYRAAE